MDANNRQVPPDTPEYQIPDYQYDMPAQLPSPYLQSVSMGHFIEGSQRGFDLQMLITRGTPLPTQRPFDYVPSPTEIAFVIATDHLLGASWALQKAIVALDNMDPAMRDVFDDQIIKVVSVHDAWYPRTVEFLKQLNHYCKEVGERFDRPLLTATNGMDFMYDLAVKMWKMIEGSQKVEYNEVLDQIATGLEQLMDQINRAVVYLRLPQRFEDSLEEKARKVLATAKQGLDHYIATVGGNRRRRTLFPTPYCQIIINLERLVVRLDQARTHGFSMVAGDRFERYSRGTPTVTQAEADIDRLVAYYNDDGE